MIELNQNNIRLYAAKHYENSSCLGEEEFTQDYSMSFRINQAIGKIDSDVTKLRRLINMIITFYNVFQSEAASRILFFNSSNPSQLKTLLVALNRFPASLEYQYSYELDISLLQLLMKEFK